jgi:Domain of unknown function (DUF4394)
MRDMRTRTKGLRLSAAVLAVLAAAGAESALANNKNGDDCASSGATGRNRLDAVALTADGRLLCFDERRPRRAREIGYVNGLTSGDTALVGIDFRVQDGALYGVGNGGGVYRLDTGNATATLVNRLSVALRGTSFGVDFNPAADRLRIVSDAGQNLRHNVNTGGVTIADADLNYTAGTAATGITGAAYTNNDLDAATGTTLFDLDATLDQIALQSPPNNGSLVATGKLTEDAGAAAGFDIYSSVWNGTTVANRALAVLDINGETCLYRVDLLTGSASYAGSFDEIVVDLAIPLAQ